VNTGASAPPFGETRFYLYSVNIVILTEEEIDRLFEQFSQGGKVIMPLTVYPCSEKFVWVADKYGVSWQLNLERS
jgi:predicted 3-demethylubiquinone-9 3-methyltransferase (glyoxalase superfamily)